MRCSRHALPLAGSAKTLAIQGIDRVLNLLHLKVHNIAVFLTKLHANQVNRLIFALHYATAKADANYRILDAPIPARFRRQAFE